MISTAMMSSMIARASRKTRTLTGIVRPSSASTPTAKAMSVAVGTAQPCASSRIAVEAQIDERRHDDATSRRDQRQNGLVESAQCAFMDLAPDLHAHDEEEDRHQRVVDPEMQRPGKDVFADTDCEAEGSKRRDSHARTESWPRISAPAAATSSAAPLTASTCRNLCRVLRACSASRWALGRSSNDRCYRSWAHASRVAARPSLDLSLLNAASTRTPLYGPTAAIQP